MKIFYVSTKVFVFIFLFFVITTAAQNSEQSIYTLRAGTVISARMDNEINSKVASVDDTFTVTVFKPVVNRETEILPAGAVIEGRIVEVKPASLAGGDGSFSVKFETLRLPNGMKRVIDATLTNFEMPKTSSARGILTVLGGTAIGALVGAVSKKENGALIGAGIGAGAGTGAAMLRKGREARIKTNEEIEIRLNKDVTLPVEDF